MLQCMVTIVTKDRRCVDCTWLQRGGAAAGGGGTTTDNPPAPGRHLRSVPRTPGTRTQPHTAGILSDHYLDIGYTDYYNIRSTFLLLKVLQSIAINLGTHK